MKRWKVFLASLISMITTASSIVFANHNPGTFHPIDEITNGTLSYINQNLPSIALFGIAGASYLTVVYARKKILKAKLESQEPKKPIRRQL